MSSRSTSPNNNQNASIDISGNSIIIPEIVNYTLNQRTDISGATIVHQQGTAVDGTAVVHSTFDTIDNNDTIDPDINVNLGQVVTSYYDNLSNSNSETTRVVNEIKDYASKINCSDFQGKGTIDDYSKIFQAASKIANETKQINLAVDISGFNEFGAAADELAELFNDFIIKLQNVNIIDDIDFLEAVSNALKKIFNLSETFGKFKETILATSRVELPKSSHEARVVVEGVMSEISCAMNYINHFVNPSASAPANSDLSATEKGIIDGAVSTIENWSVLCDQNISIAMINNPDIVYMKNASADLHSKTSTLKSNINALKAKLAIYKNI